MYPINERSTEHQACSVSKTAPRVFTALYALLYEEQRISKLAQKKTNMHPSYSPPSYAPLLLSPEHQTTVPLHRHFPGDKVEIKQVGLYSNRPGLLSLC